MSKPKRSLGTAKARGRYTYTADGLMRASLSAPLQWPGRTTRHAVDSLQDYRNRSSSPQPSLAEVYHENSKLGPENLTTIAWTAVDVMELREEYLRRRLARPSVTGAPAEIGACSHVARAAFSSEPELFFAVELLALAREAVHVYEPQLGFIRVSALNADETRAAVEAARLLEDTPREAPSAMLVLLGCFPRNEILLGVRGYRRTLLEAGRLAQTLAAAAGVFDVGVRLHLEFDDREMDGIVGVDGVEQGSLVVVELS
jgi:hypothetical protein